MIFTTVKITVKEYQSSIDKTIVLYRGDKNVEIQFEIMESKFKQYTTSGSNTINNVNASFGQLVILKPDNSSIFSDITPTKDGKIIFTIPEEMVNDEIEVGKYTFQIRLYDQTKESRITLPPVVEGIDVVEPIASEE